MEDNIHDLKLQHDRYLHEVKKPSTSLSRVKNILLPLKLVGSIFDQVAHLVRVVSMKDQALSTVRRSLGSAKKELEFLSSHNDLLT